MIKTARTLMAVIVMLLTVSGCSQVVDEEPNQEDTRPVLKDVASVDRHVWVAGQGGIWKSSDSGKSWNMQYDSGDEVVTDVVFVDEQSGWAAEGIRLLATANGGDDWGVVHEWSGDTGDWGFVTPEVGYAVSDSHLAMSQDGGKTWTTIGTPEAVDRVCFSNPDVGWIIGSSKTTYATFDSGKTWKKSGEIPRITRDHTTFDVEGVYRPSCLSDGSALVLVSNGFTAGSNNWSLYKVAAETGWTELASQWDSSSAHDLVKGYLLLPFDTEGLLVVGHTADSVVVEGFEVGSTVWQAGYIDGESYKRTDSPSERLLGWPEEGDSHRDGSAWLVVNVPADGTYLLYTEDSGRTWTRLDSPH